MHFFNSPFSPAKEKIKKLKFSELKLIFYNKYLIPNLKY